MANPSLQVELRAKDEATTAVKNLGAAGKDTTKTLKTGLIPSLLKTAAVIGAVKIAARATWNVLKSLTTGFIDAGDQMIKTARAFGLTVEELSQLRAQAELSSIEFNAMLMASRKLAQGVDDLRRGAGESREAWRFFGITVEDLEAKGSNLTSVMELLADRAAEIPDSLAKANAAGDLFGQRVGGKLIPLLNQGSDALREQSDLFRELGGIMSTEQAAAAEKAADAMALLNIAMRGLRNEIGAQVAPVIEDLILKFLDFWKTIRERVFFVVKALPVAFKAVAVAMRDIFRGGFSGDLFIEVLAKFAQLGGGMLRIIGEVAVDLWNPVVTELQVAAPRVINAWAKVLNEVAFKVASLFTDVIGDDDIANMQASIRQLEDAIARTTDPDKIAVFRNEIEELKRTLAETTSFQLIPTLSESELRSLGDEIRDVRSNAGTFRDAMAQALANTTSLINQLKVAGGDFPQLQKVFQGVAQALKQIQRETQNLGRAPEAIPTITAWQRFLGLDQNGNVQPGIGFLGALKKIREELTDVGLRGAQIGQDLVAVLGSALDNGFFKVIEGGFESTRQLFKELVADVLKGLAQIAAKQATSTLVAGAIGLVPGLAQGGVVPGNLKATVPVHAYQSGGVATSPQLALFGEGGGPGEAFIPLGPNRRVGVELRGEGGGSASNVNLTLNVQTLDAQSFATFFNRSQNVAMLKNSLVNAVNSDDGFHRAINRRR